MKTEEGTAAHVFTQIFAPDDKNLIYITRHSINSIDYSTGKLLWSTDIPEDGPFYFYQDKLFALDAYDQTVPFAPGSNINIPPECNSSHLATMRAYNPHTGKIVWEYSYFRVAPGEIYLRNNVAFIDGYTTSRRPRYSSIFEVDVQSGRILGATCDTLGITHSQYMQNYYGDILASTFGPMTLDPITHDWRWNEFTETPAFITDDSKLMMVNRQSRIPVVEIEFSGRLNPNYVQLLIQNDFLVVYLDDSNQFFTFRMK